MVGFSEAIRAELAKDGIDVLVVSPGLTQTNFSKNMLEQKAKIQLDHLRGMTSEEVAAATLRAIERGKLEMTLTFKGKLLVLVNRFARGSWTSSRRRRCASCSPTRSRSGRSGPKPQSSRHTPCAVASRMVSRRHTACAYYFDLPHDHERPAVSGSRSWS